MNTIIAEVLISVILFISFGVIPAYVFCSHINRDNISNDSYLTLDDIPSTHIQI
jgi:hypothetical protein